MSNADRPAPRRRLRLKLRSVQLLCEIDRYIRDWPAVSRDALPSAASDVLDGAVSNDEIRELIDCKLLTVIHDNPPRYRDDECGDSWTVHLTPRAITIFWPEFATPATQHRLLRQTGTLHEPRHAERGRLRRRKGKRDD